MMMMMRRMCLLQPGRSRYLNDAERESTNDAVDHVLMMHTHTHTLLIRPGLQINVMNDEYGAAAPV